MSSRLLRIALVALVFAFVFPAALPALAQTEEVAAVAAATNLGNADLITTIGSIIKVALGLVGILFLVIVIYAGFLWMTAGGDDKQVLKAKAFLINAVVGIVVILMAYAITSFIVNLLSDATGSGNGGGPNETVTVESLSGSLGNGPIQDHYPLRSQNDVARNTNIIITFRQPMDIESFITGYDTAGTPTDLSDDVVATAIKSENIKIYPSAGGEAQALTEVAVYFSEDLKTVVFNPVAYLGSSTEDVSYTVKLENDIENADGAKVFTGINGRGYEWTFATGVNLDLQPPKVLTVTPVAGGSYAKNIVVQMTFNEPIDPTSATGVRTNNNQGFSNIQVVGGNLPPTPGQYLISNGYRTITFQPTINCGTNSCNETIFCLPGGQTMTNTIFAATTTASPPQADTYPYNGVVDVAANSLDGDGNGTAGDDYVWSFNTTNEIYLDGTAIETMTPDILEPNVALDQDISMTFTDILMSSTVNSDNLTLTNKEIASGDPHEQWFRMDVSYLTASGEEVVNNSMVPVKSVVTMPHGVLLESIDGKTYMYGVQATQGLRNEYQNCYLPAEGPGRDGVCGVSNALPYCCNGTASASACVLF